MESWHNLNTEQAFAQLKSRPDGLTEAQIADRLIRFGSNLLQTRKPASPIKLFFKQFANYFIIVLLFAAALAYWVSFMPGQSERRLTSYFILGIIVLSVLLSFFEEYRSQRELESLGRMLVFRTSVLRKGTRLEIDASQVVPGDVMVLTQGQKVPADGRIFDAHSLRADKSPLTGESLGVEKTTDTLPSGTPLAERSNMIFASTFITHGSGLALVVATGSHTQVGQIADTLESMEARQTPFQVEVHKMARQMTIIIGALTFLVALILFFILKEPLVEVVLYTLSLAVATIPESLPIVLTFALALGARQMVREGAVVRNLSVVESLGSIDTICTDKTGTLTQNQMVVKQLFSSGQLYDLSNEPPEHSGIQNLLQAAVLCNEGTIEQGLELKILGDPVDTALLKAARQVGLDIDQIRTEHPLVNTIPFSSERKMMTTLHQGESGVLAITKGAPGIVLGHCTACEQNGQKFPLTDPHCQSVQQTIRDLQSGGMYVLGLAYQELASSEIDEQLELEMTFMGLLVLMDPPRPQAAEAIRIAHQAGIRVVMITGDNGLTAQASAS